MWKGKVKGLKKEKEDSDHLWRKKRCNQGEKKHSISLEGKEVNELES